jgi:hypothetical protein
MIRQAVAVVLILTLAGLPAAAQSTQPTLKERVLEIKPHALVEVKLLEKGRPKLRGRIHSVTDQGFSLRVARGDKIEDATVAFADLKSIKVKEGHHPGRDITLGILAGVGVTFLTLFAIFASLDD